ncbi:MAG: ABC transporter permease [Castellaniella sp.]|nr:ABC transporter permease [Castellaniella sp.]
MRNLAKVLGVVALALLTWQYGAPAMHIPDYALPLPSQIGLKFAQTFALQMENLAVTAVTTLVGLGAGLAAGIFLALLVLYIRGLRVIVEPALAAFNGIPKIAIAPLLVIWFGLGSESKIVLAFLLCLFPIFVNALTGLSEIDTDILDLSRLYGGNATRIFFKVRLMHALPYLVDALKVSFPLALAGSIVGEFIGGNRGIGYLVLSGQFNLDTPLVFAALLSITLFTVAGIGLINLFERTFLRWMPTRRQR